MENITGMVSRVLEEQKVLYQELSVLLAGEKDYIVSMDVGGLWKLTERKKELVNAIEGLSLSLARRFEPIPESRSPKTKAVQVLGVINNLSCPSEVKSELKKTWRAVKELKDEIAVTSKANLRFINDYLSVIQDIFSTVTNPGGEKKYSQTGKALPASAARSLINARV